jgi:hypothetical protein
MASLDILILLSSPPKAFTTYNMSSSPLPSLSELTQRKAPTLRTESRAVSIPQNASASFTSAASLLKTTSAKDLLGVDAIRSFRMDTGDDGDPIDELPKLSKAKLRKVTAKKVEDGEEKVAKVARKTATKKHPIDGEAQPKKPRKSRAKVADQDGGENDTVKEPAPRKPRTKKADKEPNANEGSKEKPARKPKSKKSDGDPQTKLAKGQVTKTSSTSVSDKVDKATKLKQPESAATKSLDPFTDPVDLGLVEAVQRRMDWTPPMPTKTMDVTRVTGGQLDHGSTSSGSVLAGERSKAFTDLFGSFGFSKLDNIDVGKKSLETEKPRKRKLMELVKTSVLTAAAASPKEKAPKKKAKTITGQATSAYAEEEEVPAKPAPLLQYFSRQTTEGTNDGFKVPAKPRSKSPVKGGSRAKKGSADAPILLSPRSALKQSGNQDFVFGTSSQLAREESPTLLRDLHEAMQASNKVNEDDPFADLVHESTSADRGRALVSAKRNLWSAAARDTGGSLLEVEMVDLVDSPAITKQTKQITVPEVVAPSTNEVNEEVWLDIKELSKNQSQIHQNTTETIKAVEPLEAVIRAELLSSPPSKSKSNEPTPKNSKTKRKDEPPTRQSKSPAKTKSANPKDSQMPDFSAYTTAQLAKEIASYRFKPVKNRDQMITLLEKCWEGKNRIALGALGTNVLSQPPIESSKTAVPASSQMSTASPKRPRGRPPRDSATTSPPSKVRRPKKSTTVGFLEMDSDTPLSQIRTPKRSKKKGKEVAEDISDSDTPMTPSPPHRTSSQVRTSPLPLKLSTDLEVDTSPELSPTASQALLFKHITRAVKNAPPSKDPSKPSWHEKILLYDPIILEDLTVWLNTGALEKVGWDGEVEPKEVKKWAESKSICCLWKENLRGGARSRY